MSSTIETLLEAARYIEMQEMRQLSLTNNSSSGGNSASGNDSNTTPSLSSINVGMSSPQGPIVTLVAAAAAAAPVLPLSAPAPALHIIPHNIRFNNTINHSNQLVTQSPQGSPVHHNNLNHIQHHHPQQQHPTSSSSIAMNGGNTNSNSSSTMSSSSSSSAIINHQIVHHIHHNNQSSPPQHNYSDIILTSNGSAINASNLRLNGGNTISREGNGVGITTATRHIINEEPFLNGHSIAPPLVVISQQQQQQQPPVTPLPQNSLHQTNNSNTNRSSNNSHHQSNHNSLSPPSQSSASSSSFEMSRSRSSSISSTNLQQSTPPSVSSTSSLGSSVSQIIGTAATNGIYAHTILQNGDDSNQSSLNLSNISSGYLSGSSANSSIGGGVSLNLSTPNSGGTIININPAMTITNGILTTAEQQMAQSISSGGRRRTTSTNSNGAGTREVHNKLEKNRRAHLKECFEQLKKQLPQMPEEKKISNLSILGAAIRHVHTLKRKERELEHEMERLAKDKIAAQQKILLLKRELNAQWDHMDFSTMIPDSEVTSIREKEPIADIAILTSGRGGQRYSSSSSLSSAATSSSPCSNIGLTINSTQLPATAPSQQQLLTSASPVIAAAATTLHGQHPNLTQQQNSSPRQHNTSSPNAITLPLSLTTTTTSAGGKTITTTNCGPQLIDISSLQAFNKKTQITSSGTATNQAMAINLTTDSGISPALIVASTGGSMSGMTPINFNISTNSSQTTGGTIGYTTQSSMGPQAGLQMISTNSTLRDLNGKNGIRVAEFARQDLTTSSLMVNKEGKMELLTTKLDSTEPATKVIKLINGNTIALAPVVDKDNKIIGSGSTLTLQQVVGGGGLVVSQIPFLTSSGGGLRVIGQAPNGLATIELSSPMTQNANGGRSMAGAGAQLHKLLVSGTANTITTSANTTETARLPGGAELNILPASANQTYYRNQKLAIVNNGITLKGEVNNPSSRVHVVAPLQSNTSTLSGLTPIVMQQGQTGANITQLITGSSSQLTGKVMAPLSVSGHSLPLSVVNSTASYVTVKPMVIGTVASTAAYSNLPPPPPPTSICAPPLSVTVSSSSSSSSIKSASVAVSSSSNNLSSVTGSYYSV